MAIIVLSNTAEDGTPLEAAFSPDDGLSLISFKKGSVEVMEKPGTLIGPHFQDRNSAIIPPLPEGKVWPQLEGHSDPFAFGIARYAPWEVINDETSLRGVLNGKQEWQGATLGALEGQQFTITFQASLTPHGLMIGISVVSDADSLVGLDYHFRLPEGRNTLNSDVKEVYFDGKEPKPVPATWGYELADRRINIDLSQPASATFHPFLNPLDGNILLDTSQYQLRLRYRCQSQENAWQLIRPAAASYVSIRPLSAKMPFRPILSVSSLEVTLAIL